MSARVCVAALLAAMLLASACGATSAPTTTDGSMGDSMDADMGADAHSHGHQEDLEVPNSMATPAVEIAVTPDAVSGQNLTVSLTNFDVTPELASLDPVDGGGHLHLYVDGERVGRFYNEALHLNLEPGDHVVEVELSANNHQAWSIGGEAIRASAQVTVEESTGGHMHGHDMDASGEVTWSPAPTVSLTVTEDPKSGWNVHADVDNFELSAVNASGDAVDGQGHMHLYVNGKKITRLYGEWHLLTELTPGTNEVMVELNANDHTPLTVDGQPIAATVNVEVIGAADQMDMSESTMAAMEDGAIVLGLRDGKVISDRDRYEVTKGEPVVLLMDSDVAERIHVHGYDLYQDVGPGETARLEFVADISGVFEVELEDSGQFLAELQVR